MTEYKYQKEDYISPKDFSHFNETMENVAWDIKSIDDKREFQILLNYLVSLIVRAPLFLPAYEIAVSMIDAVDPEDPEDELTETLLIQLEQKWFEACALVVAKEDVFDKVVRYSVVENQPLMKGLNNGAEVFWVVCEIEKAHGLFSKLKALDPDDRVGARFSAKATGEGMEHEAFKERFTITQDGEESFDIEGLMKWYGES